LVCRVGRGKGVRVGVSVAVAVGVGRGVAVSVGRGVALAVGGTWVGVTVTVAAGTAARVMEVHPVRKTARIMVGMGR